MIIMDIPVEIQKMMGPKETIELFVDGETYTQATTDSLAVTSDRIILRRALAPDVNTDLKVYSYSDITGVGVEKGFLRSIVRLRLKTGESMDAIRLPPKQAEQVVNFIKDKVCRHPSSL
jgi:hypothetical protein